MGEGLIEWRNVEIRDVLRCAPRGGSNFPRRRKMEFGASFGMEFRGGGWVMWILVIWEWEWGECVGNVCEFFGE